MPDYPYLEFWGGVGTVTGSKYLLHTGAKKILIDCGLFQGEREIRRRNWTPPPFDPAELDAIILTHAHIDHSGYLPVMMNRGFTGPIYCTEATRDLCAVLLPDSGYLKEKHAKHANKYGYSRHSPALPLYTQQDGEDVLEFFEPKPFKKTIRLGPGLSLRFLRAGHILGAAIVSFHIGGRHIVFSGDLGRPNSATMMPPDDVTDVDYLVVESTYGDRLHTEDNPEAILLQIIDRVTARGGSIVIPCFAVGRTQSLLFHIWNLKQAGHLQNVPVFLDSPMAINASDLFCRHKQDHRMLPQACHDIFNVATYVKTVEASKAIAVSPYPKIILSASGMATGGRVVHHLKAYIREAKNAVIFTGFQARGTRGDALVHGADKIKIHGQMHPVKAEIHQLSMLSAHADRGEIMAWLSRLNQNPNMTFITHGEEQSATALADAISGELHWPVTVPTYGDRVLLK